MRTLFIHRSVGHHLIEHGKLRELLNTKGVRLDDYDNNTDSLTHDDGSVASGVIDMPGDNTNPENLAAFFKEWNRILDDYDLIMIKSCYPNSRIKSDDQLDRIKEDYSAIFKAFTEHKRPLVILTTPPLRPVFTNVGQVKRADELASWLTASTVNLAHVFDFRKLLAEPGGRHAGMLKRRYRHALMPWDNHPKRLAHQVIAPQLVSFLASIYPTVAFAGPEADN